MPIKNKYDWVKIQKDYDGGFSYRDLISKYGMSMQTLAKAKKRGDLFTRNLKESRKLYLLNNPPAVMGEDARKRQSERMSKNNPGGKCQWFYVNGIAVQGTWERDFALHCNKNNIKWERCQPFVYIKDGKTKRYTPDFYLPEYDIFIEIKGKWWGDDKNKMECVIKQHPNKKIKIIEKDDFYNIIENNASVV